MSTPPFEFKFPPHTLSSSPPNNNNPFDQAAQLCIQSINNNNNNINQVPNIGEETRSISDINSFNNNRFCLSR